MDRYIPCKRPERLENIKIYPKRTWAKYNITKEEYEKLIEQGLNNKEIATKVGMAYGRLQTWRHKNGYVTKHRTGRHND